MTDGERADGGAAGQGMPPQEAAARLGALGAALGGIRRRLALGLPPDHELLRQTQASCPDMRAIAQSDAVIEAALLGLLDELGGLVADLERERAALRALIQSGDRQRQALASYAAQSPSP